jgi:hypothetical protein
MGDNNAGSSNMNSTKERSESHAAPSSSLGAMDDDIPF